MPGSAINSFEALRAHLRNAIRYQDVHWYDNAYDGRRGFFAPTRASNRERIVASFCDHYEQHIQHAIETNADETKRGNACARILGHALVVDAIPAIEPKNGSKLRDAIAPFLPNAGSQLSLLRHDEFTLDVAADLPDVVHYNAQKDQFRQTLITARERALFFEILQDLNDHLQPVMNDDGNAITLSEISGYPKKSRHPYQWMTIKGDHEQEWITDIAYDRTEDDNSDRIFESAAIKGNDVDTLIKNMTEAVYHAGENLTPAQRVAIASVVDRAFRLTHTVRSDDRYGLQVEKQDLQLLEEWEKTYLIRSYAVQALPERFEMSLRAGQNAQPPKTLSVIWQLYTERADKRALQHENASWWRRLFNCRYHDGEGVGELRHVIERAKAVLGRDNPHLRQFEQYADLKRMASILHLQAERCEEQLNNNGCDEMQKRLVNAIRKHAYNLSELFDQDFDQIDKSDVIDQYRLLMFAIEDASAYTKYTKGPLYDFAQDAYCRYQRMVHKHESAQTASKHHFYDQSLSRVSDQALALHQQYDKAYYGIQNTLSVGGLSMFISPTQRRITNRLMSELADIHQGRVRIVHANGHDELDYSGDVDMKRFDAIIRKVVEYCSEEGELANSYPALAQKVSKHLEYYDHNTIKALYDAKQRGEMRIDAESDLKALAPAYSA